MELYYQLNHLKKVENETVKFEKQRLLNLKSEMFSNEEVKKIIDYLYSNYTRIINKTVFEIEKDKNIISLNLLKGFDLNKIRAELILKERYTEIVARNKKLIY